MARERLLGLRPDPAEASVVTIIAPAGYGKSTLLHSWVEAADLPVVWLSLDRRDNDPVTLATSIALAILEAWPSARAIEAALETPMASIWSLLMPRVSAELKTRSPFIQVIDDIHEISEPECLDVVNSLALQVPAGSQLVIAGRTATGLARPRLHLERRIVEIGVDQLRISDDEARELLRASGLEMTAEQGAELNQACDGWISGLLLSAMGDPVRATSRQPALPARGSDLLRQYIHSEVLSRMSPDEVDFLLRTSVLRELSAPLCDAVLERTGSAVLLGRLCDSNAFMTPVQGDRCRYHDMFREALSAELKRMDPALVASLCGRAAEWHALHDDPVEAVSYAMESGDDDLTSRLIQRFAQPTFNAGRTPTVRRWLDWAEESDLVRGDPLLALSGYFVLALGGEGERAVRWSRSLHDAAAGGHDESAGWSALASAVACRSGASAALTDALRASELIGSVSPWRGAALATLGLCQMMNGRPAESEAALLEVVDPYRSKSPDANARSIAYALLARRLLDAGDLEGARQHLEQAARLRASNGIGAQGMQAMIDALLARLAITADADLAQTRSYLAHAQTVRPLLTWAVPGPALIARLDLAQAHLALADVTAARLLLREASDILRRRPGMGALGDETRRLKEQVSTHLESAPGPSALTDAELRLVPWLATHLSFREIGERLFLSPNTVKTEALAIYRKVGASSRSEAVVAAVRFGLLDPAAVPSVLEAASWIDHLDG